MVPVETDKRPRDSKSLTNAKSVTKDTSDIIQSHEIDLSVG